MFAFRSDYPRAVRSDGTYALELAPGHHQVLPPLALDLELQLREAAEHGIDVLLTSPIHLGEVLGLDANEAAEYLERLNGIVAEAQREHAGRVTGLALLPMQDTDAALTVLEKAVADGLRGILLLASVDGRSVVSETTLPVYARVAELGLPLFLHPCVRSNTRTPYSTFRAEAGLGWMYHTSLAALDLIDGGILDGYPDLVVVHPHLGGVLPYVAGRIDDFPRVADRSVIDYLRTNFYIDVVGVTPGALGLTIELYGIERVLYGTDYPFIPIARAEKYLEVEVDAACGRQIRANGLPGLLSHELVSPSAADAVDTADIHNTSGNEG